MTAPAKEKPQPQQKEKQEKPSVQTPQDQQAEEAIENVAHHGGRTKWPDGDVNPAPDLHVDEDEEGEPAATRNRHAQRRDDKDRGGRKKPREDASRG